MKGRVHRSNGANIVIRFLDMARTKLTARKSCNPRNRAIRKKPRTIIEFASSSEETRAPQQEPEEIPPKEDPTKIPAEEPEEDPEEDPTEIPVEEPEEDPTEIPVEEPEEDPEEDPTEIPVEEPKKDPEEEAEDPDLQTDAESEYRPMNGLLSIRASPERRRVSYPPVIYSESPYDATCVWEW